MTLTEKFFTFLFVTGVVYLVLLAVLIIRNKNKEVAPKKTLKAATALTVATLILVYVVFSNSIPAV